MAADSGMKALFAAADAAGKAAAAAVVPRPMIVIGDGRVYEPVMDGVCGFAWVKIRPGNSAAAKFAKANYGASASYSGGVDIWVSAYNQSMVRKEAYANAFAKVLRDAGINAYGDSRMD